LARRDAKGVRLYTRNGYNFADRFPRIVEAVASLPVKSCFIDGEAIVVDERGVSAFDLLRSWRHDRAAVLCAFDLIELDGKDLRQAPRRSVSIRWPMCSTGSVTASSSTNITIAMARSFPNIIFGSNNLTVTLASTPLPAALTLFAAGLGALGLLGWRRKRKAQPVEAPALPSARFCTG
jgi:hypothetical protein